MSLKQLSSTCHVSFFAAPDTDHKHKFSLTHFIHFFYLYDGLTFAHKPYDSRPFCTQRCSTAEWRINTNPVSDRKRTKAQVEVKTSSEALQKKHGQPIRMLPEDWTSVMVKFKSKYGKNLQEEELLAQAYFEEFQEKLAAGMLQAEPLDQVISQAEAEEQDPEKPDPPRQYGIHLNAALTIQMRRRYTSTLPANCEELRAKYEVLSNCWLLGQQRQPGRALYSDVDTTTIPRILKELLGKKNFALKKELDDKPLVAPPWANCLSYELELRREACKKCREQNMGFSAAWWQTYGDSEHRVLHWLQVVSLANSSPSRL